MTSPLTEYLENLVAQGHEIPSSIDDLPAEWRKWIKGLAKFQTLRPQGDGTKELQEHIERSIDYARAMTPQSEEEQRAFANRLYYAVLNLARLAFGEPLDEGYDTHKRWAAHLLQRAVVHRMPTLGQLIEVERLRAELYRTRIQADYNLLARFSLPSVALHRAKAATLFNAMLELLEDQERRAIE